MIKFENITVAVVGLGYVGLPLAIELGNVYQTIGYDLSEEKIESYSNHIDPTGEVDEQSFREAKNTVFSSDPSTLFEADFIIVAVPTPVDSSHRPDFAPLISASSVIGKHMKKGAIIIYESTVYPGATEEICVPILAKESGFTWKQDFNVGYSPERINPGDKNHSISTVVKVIAGDNDETLNMLDELYGSIIKAGVYRANSIKVAEAAKVIENTQRDLNIALMNELSVLFDRLEIDTVEVLKAAETKWNFIPFRPGLVGGHCIGVDPYYLTHKAEMVGYNPQVILAGRRINDEVPSFIVQKTIKQLIGKGALIQETKIGILGLTFKENCRDIRNSKVFELAREFFEYGCEVHVCDPIADVSSMSENEIFQLVEWQNMPVVDALVIAVAHEVFVRKPTAHLLNKLKAGGIFVDIKAAFPQREIEHLGYSVWRL